MSLKQNNNQRCTCAFVSFDNHRASHCKLKKWSKASFLYPIAHQNKSNSPKKNNKMKVTIQENNNLTEKTSETTATEKTLITQYQNDNNNDNRSHSLQSEATLTTMETIETDNTMKTKSHTTASNNMHNEIIDFTIDSTDINTDINTNTHTDINTDTHTEWVCDNTGMLDDDDISMISETCTQYMQNLTIIEYSNSTTNNNTTTINNNNTGAVGVKVPVKYTNAQTRLTEIFQTYPTPSTTTTSTATIISTTPATATSSSVYANNSSIVVEPSDSIV